MTDDFRYPIGREPSPVSLTPGARAAAIAVVHALPAQMRDAVAGLSANQLDTPYRPGGWTVRQLVHHVADSHLNAYIRFKLALTEDEPRIVPYDERAWAALPDSRLDVGISVDLLEAVHARWTTLYASLDEAELDRRRFYHPERQATVTLAEQLQSYAWHSRHHVAHITRLRDRERW
jgi:uncharacterized damage-inducible protein DinB